MSAEQQTQICNHSHADADEAFVVDGICPLCQRERINRLIAALRAVEKWWLDDGMKHFDGAPYAIFAARQAISDSERE